MNEIQYEIDNYQFICLQGLKIVDICVGSAECGCRCSTSGDRNRYDKESETIICEHYNECLKRMLKKIQENGLLGDFKGLIESIANIR